MAENVKEARHERGLLQALQRFGPCEKWDRARPSALSLPFVWLQFHHDAAAWQAAGDEDAGAEKAAVFRAIFG
ncbi:MAG: hypothetical protein ACLPN5_14410 [Roseiarcus sp.]